MTSTVVNRSSVSHCSRRVSTRPSETGGQNSHGVKSSSTTMPPGSTRSATASTPTVVGLAGVEEEQRERALVEQRRPVGGQHLDLGVVGEDLGGRAGQLGVELGGEDPGVRRGRRERSQAVPTPLPVPNSASVPLAGRGQRGQQPAGLVAAERHVAGACARRRRRATRSSGRSGGALMRASLRIAAVRGVSHRRTSLRGTSGVRGRARTRRTVAHHAERLRTYRAPRRGLTKQRPPRRGVRRCTASRPLHRSRSPPRRSPPAALARSALSADPRRRHVIRASVGVPAAGHPGRRTDARPSDRPLQETPMYDMYPEWGPASHQPREPAAATRRVQAVARPARQRRRAPRRQLASAACTTPLRQPPDARRHPRRRHRPGGHRRGPQGPRGGRARRT